MAGEVIGWGGEFKIGNAAATPVLTEVLNVTSITLPQDTVETTEVTHLKSPNKRREYLATMIDGGEMQIQGNYVPGSATDLMLAAIVGLDRAWECTIPTTVGASKKWKFSGQGAVISYEPSEVVVDQAMTFTLTIKVSGAVTQGAST